MPKFLEAQRQKQPDSRDYGLFVVFSVGTLLQTVLPVNGLIRCGIAVAWAGIVMNSAMKHRDAHQWQWQGATKTNVLNTIRGLLLGVYIYPLFVIRAVDHMNVDATKWAPDTFLECFTQTARVISQLLVSTNPMVSFLLLPIGWGLFIALVELKIAYLYDEGFLKDCQRKNHKKQRKTSNISSAAASRVMVTRFFSVRPFVLAKQKNTVRISFYKISSQDINENIVAVAFSCFIFLVFVVGTVNMFRFGLIEFIHNESITSDFRTAMITVGIFQCAIFAIGALLLWVLSVRHLFAVRTVYFRADKVIMTESLLGFSWRVLRVHPNDLSPLIEKRKRTKIPEVRNTARRCCTNRGYERSLAR